MMRMVYTGQIEDELAFARKAAAHFASEPRHSTYTDGEIQPGCFLAIRWVLGDDCVVVVKLDDAHVPTNYAEIVRQFQMDARP
jgi:hypothetical protein